MRIIFFHARADAKQIINFFRPNDDIFSPSGNITCGRINPTVPSTQAFFVIMVIGGGAGGFILTHRLFFVLKMRYEANFWYVRYLALNELNLKYFDSNSDVR